MIAEGNVGETESALLTMMITEDNVGGTEVVTREKHGG